MEIAEYRQNRVRSDHRKYLTPLTHVPLLFMLRWKYKHVSSLEMYGKFAFSPRRWTKTSTLIFRSMRHREHL